MSASCGDYRLNKHWSNYWTLCPTGPVLRTFVQHLITFVSRPEAASEVISGEFVGPTLLDRCVKFRCHSLNASREILPEAVGGGISDSFFRYNFRPEVDNDVLFGVAVDNVGVGICVEFGNSRSNGFLDIRLAVFVSNGRTNITKPITIVEAFHIQTAYREQDQSTVF